MRGFCGYKQRYANVENNAEKGVKMENGEEWERGMGKRVKGQGEGGVRMESRRRMRGYPHHRQHP